MREHRTWRRTAADHDAVIYPQDRPAIAGKIRNVSQQGLYVVTGVGLPQHSKVNVHFDLPKESRDQYRMVAATVVHRDRDGVGLMVDLTQTEAAGRLRVLAELCQEFEGHG